MVRALLHRSRADDYLAVADVLRFDDIVNGLEQERASVKRHPIHLGNVAGSKNLRWGPCACNLVAARMSAKVRNSLDITGASLSSRAPDQGHGGEDSGSN